MSVQTRMIPQRKWMYERKGLKGDAISHRFSSGVRDFIAFATTQPSFMDESPIKCP